MDKHINYKDTEIFYRVLKNSHANTTVLFLHGWGGNSRSFAHIEPYFVAKYNCIFISLPMFQLADTHAPQTPYTLEDYANITQTVIDSESVKQPLLVVAHSFGARVAVKMASKQPHLFDRLLLTGAAGIPPRRRMITKLKILVYKIKRRLWGISEHGHGSSDYRCLTAAGKRTFQNLLAESLCPCIAQLTVPTLLIFGRKDRSTPPRMGKQFTKICKTSKLLIYEDAGHFCFIDYPSRFIIDAQDFFKESKKLCSNSIQCKT